MSDFIGVDPSEGCENHDIPERALWLAVIEQQVSDATFGFSRKIDKDNEAWVHYRRPKMEHINLHEEAMSWFYNNNDTFIPICTLALVDPHYVRDRVKRVLTALELMLGELPSRQNFKRKKQ